MLRAHAVLEAYRLGKLQIEPGMVTYLFELPLAATRSWSL